MTAQTSLSVALLARAAHAEAEPLMRSVLERRTRLHGPEHPYTLTARNNLAGLLLATGRSSEAEPEFRAILETSRRVLTRRHPNTIQATYNLANTLRELGRSEESEALFLEAIDLDRAHLPAGHWFSGLHRSRYGELLAALDRPQEAERELQAGFHVLETALGLEHERTQRVVAALVALYEEHEDADLAAEWRARRRESER